MTHASPILIVFGGLPGTGKTTIARKVAAEWSTTYLRIDDIEQAIRSARMLTGDVGPAGYLAAYALAESNLKLGRIVIVDCVNPLPVTRTAWRSVASVASSIIVEIEIICSDLQEHRRRVESRVVDIPGLTPPTWSQVQAHHYQPWTEPRVVIDTTVIGADEAVRIVGAEIKSSLQNRSF